MNTKWNIRKRHFAALIELLGVDSSHKFRGYLAFPPSFSDRIWQEIGYCAAIVRIVIGKKPVVVSGRSLKYIHGQICLEPNPTLLSVVEAKMQGDQVISIQRNHFESTPLEELSSVYGLEFNKKLFARIGYNTLIVLFARVADQEVVIHYPVDEEGERSIIRHKTGLERARQSLGGSTSLSLVPTIIQSTADTKLPLLIQTRVVGHTLQADTPSLEQSSEKLGKCIAFLTGMQSNVEPNDHSPEAEHFTKNIANLDADMPSKHKLKIRYALDKFDNWWRTKNLKPVFVHGDFWLGNVLFDDEGSISGVIDWEWSRENGMPLFDAMHLLTRSGFCHNNASFPELLSSVWKGGENWVWMAGYLDEVIQESGLSHNDVQHIALLLWLDTIWKGYVVTQPEYAEWLDDMIEVPFEAIETWANHESGQGNGG